MVLLVGGHGLSGCLYQPMFSGRGRRVRTRHLDVPQHIIFNRSEGDGT